MQLLVDQGAKLNNYAIGKTSLIETIKCENMEIFKYLLEKDADTKMRDEGERSVLNLTRKFELPEWADLLDKKKNTS